MRYSSDLQLLTVLRNLYSPKLDKNSSIKVYDSLYANNQTDPNSSINILSKKPIEVNRRFIPKSPCPRIVIPIQKEKIYNRAISPFQSHYRFNSTSSQLGRATPQLYSPITKNNYNNISFNESPNVNKSQLFIPRNYLNNSSMTKFNPLSNSQSLYDTNNSINFPYNNQHSNNRKRSVDNIFGKPQIKGRYNNRESKLDAEEIILLEHKINSIMSLIIKGKECAIACCDWWSFYISSSLLQNQTNFFTEDSYKLIIYSASNVMFLAVILCYDISDEEGLYSQLNLLFKTIFTLIQLNSLLIFKFILGKIKHDNEMINEFENYLFEKINGEAKVELDEANICNMIKHNCTSIVDLTILILNNYIRSRIYNQLFFYFNNISKITPEELNVFFINCVYQTEKHKARSLTVKISPSNFFYDTFPQINPPFLPLKKDKRLYTLILDLDETLVSFESNKENKGLLVLRPGLNEFLSIIKEYYELILFTTAVKEYADPIANLIEKTQKFFDYRLYRNHSMVNGNNRVKDLSKLGRDLNKIMIVDNQSDNYKLQKENGILIQPFYGDNTADSTLCQLTLFLIKIAKEANEENQPDLRLLLVKYHTEVTSKISSNLHHYIEKENANPVYLNVKTK